MTLSPDLGIYINYKTNENINNTKIMPSYHIVLYLL